jgi:hypothetical protein
MQQCCATLMQHAATTAAYYSRPQWRVAAAKGQQQTLLLQLQLQLQLQLGPVLQQ